MTLKLLTRCRTFNGDATGTWSLLSIGNWGIHWHRREPKCHLGLYTNWRCGAGLVAALNLPIIGDFSLWRSWSPPKPPAKQPGWQTSEMECNVCGYYWVAVAPVTAEYYECKECGHMNPAPYVETEP